MQTVFLRDRLLHGPVSGFDRQVPVQRLCARRTPSSMARSASSSAASYAPIGSPAVCGRAALLVVTLVATTPLPAPRLTAFLAATQRPDNARQWLTGPQGLHGLAAKKILARRSEAGSNLKARPYTPVSPIVAGLALLATGLFSAAARAETGMCTQPDVAGAASALDFSEQLVIEADQAQLEQSGLSNLVGGVRLTQGGNELTAEAVEFDREQREFSVDADSVFRNPQLVIRSQRARFNLNSRTGVFSGTDFTLPGRSARGRSEEIVINAAGTADLKETSYTSCAPGDDSWYIEAAEIHLDHDEGLGRARNATLRFAGVPILYLPYLQFPIDDRRRTGFLFPTAGQNSQSGFDFRWPVYFNLAPNYDATVTPRLMTDRGIQIGAAFRYLLPHSEGAASIDYLDDDKDYGDSRQLVTFNHQGLLSSRLGLSATYAEVSDREYFEDISSSLQTSSLTHLEQNARVVYQSPGAYRLQAMVQRYQPIANSLGNNEDPYRRLPQVRFDTLSRHSLLDTRIGMNAEVVNFAREDSVQGVRSDFQPYLLYLHDETAWYLRGQADMRYTRYELNDTPAGQSDSPDRALPVLSAEGGLRFERRTGNGAIQTLEPRGFALYAPYRNQDDLPLFDTGEPDFDFIQLFSRNRYSSVDRISDAQHVAGALTTRMIDPMTGVVRWSASVGQMFRFESPRVELPDQPAPQSGATEFIAEFDYLLSRKWRTVITSQWSPETSKFERTNLAFHYRDPDDGERFDLAYRKRQGLLEQVDASFSWPIFANWRLATRQRYSLVYKRTLENLIGVEYETCCWAIRTSYRQFVASNSGDFNSGIYLQLELKGLTRIGTGFNEMLPYSDQEDTSWYE